MPRRLEQVDFGALIRRDPDLVAARTGGRAAGLRLLLVGGAVRDALLGRKPRDSDLIVCGPPAAALRWLDEFSGGRFVVFDRRGLLERRVLRDGHVLDVVLVTAPELEGEMRRRDFTINAVAVDLDDGQVLDPHGGIADLETGLLRAVTPHSLSEDPLRALRALRFLATGAALALHPDTEAAIRAAAAAVPGCAGERIGEEMDRLASAPRLSGTLRRMRALGLLQVLLPEVADLVGVTQNAYHHLDVWEHTLAALDAAEDGTGTDAVPALGRPEGEDRLVLMHAVLCHDLGKPATRSVGDDGRVHFFGHEKISARLAEAIAGRLVFSLRRTRRIVSLARLHLRPGAVGPPAGPSAVRRLVHAAGDDLELLIRLALADTSATGGMERAARDQRMRLCCRLLHDCFLRQGEEIVRPRPLIDGHEMMRLTGLAPGPQLGGLLQALIRLQVDGSVRTRAQALEALRDGRLSEPQDPPQDET